LGALPPPPSRRRDEKDLQADIKARLLARGRHGLERHGLERHARTRAADVPAVGLTRARDRLAAPLQRARPAHGAPPNRGEHQTAGLQPGTSALLLGGDGVPAVAALKAREARPAPRTPVGGSTPEWPSRVWPARLAARGSGGPHTLGTPRGWS